MPVDLTTLVIPELPLWAEAELARLRGPKLRYVSPCEHVVFLARPDEYAPDLRCDACGERVHFQIANHELITTVGG